MTRLIASVSLLLLQALLGCGSGGTGNSSSSSGELAPITTLAFAVTECRIASNEVRVQQEVRILREGKPPVVAARLDLGSFGSEIEVDYARPGNGPQRLNLEGYCRTMANTGLGIHSVYVFPLQDVAVSPDGTTVAFEVSWQFSRLPGDVVPDTEEGIFVVTADGRGLTRIGSPRMEPPTGTPLGRFLRALAFSPGGEAVVFVDSGPSPSGTTALQIWTLDLSTGERVQITNLPEEPEPGEPGVGEPDPTLDYPFTCCAYFLDRETIAFTSKANPSNAENPEGVNPDHEPILFTIRTDGTNLRAVPPPSNLPEEAQLSPVYSITGSRPSIEILRLPGPRNEIFYVDSSNVESPNVLQLTNFGVRITCTDKRLACTDPKEPAKSAFPLVDLETALLSVHGDRVFFPASVNQRIDALGRPMAGENPTYNCQVFSMNTTGTDLRQLTRFEEDGGSNYGCWFSELRGCAVGGLFQDPRTETLVFRSNCNPSGTNTARTGQFFAIRADGGGLRQLSNFRGDTTGEDGTELIEVSGPSGYPLAPGQRPGG